MGFFAPDTCAASFPKEILWTFSVLCVRGLLGAFSRSSSLNFFSSSRSDSLPKGQTPSWIKYPQQGQHWRHTRPSMGGEGHVSVWHTHWSTLRAGHRVTLGIVLVPQSSIPVSKYPLHPCPRPPSRQWGHLVDKAGTAPCLVCMNLTRPELLINITGERIRPQRFKP